MNLPERLPNVCEHHQLCPLKGVCQQLVDRRRTHVADMCGVHADAAFTIGRTMFEVRAPRGALRPPETMF